MLPHESPEYAPPAIPSNRSAHRNYIFNFRDESELPECRCGDAATWPEPRPSHDLDRPRFVDAGPTFEEWLAAELALREAS